MTRFNGYPPSYHAAVRELIHFGASRSSRANAARQLIANALRDLRARYGGEFTRNARYGMLYISGHFPDKV